MNDLLQSLGLPPDVVLVVAVGLITALAGAAIGALVERRRLVRRLTEATPDADELPEPVAVAVPAEDRWEPPRRRHGPGGAALAVLAVGAVAMVGASIAAGATLATQARSIPPVLPGPAPAAPPAPVQVSVHVPPAPPCEAPADELLP